MTPLKMTRTMLVSALCRQFGSTIQFFLISNQAVLSGEVGYRQKIYVYMIVNRRLFFFQKEKDMDIIMNVDTTNSQIVYYHYF